MEAVFQIQAGVSPQTLTPLLQRLGVAAAPMHPGSNDAALARWYALSADDEAALESAIEALRGHEGVAAAYIKPEGEPPG